VMDEAERPVRHSRRRTATRAALVRAARGLLGEAQDSTVNIQTITEHADVGFGTFFNHFQSKDELFDTAVAEILEEYANTIDDLIADIEDPAEVFAAGFRLTARLVTSSPELMQTLRRRGLDQLRRSDGLVPRALRDIEKGVAAGRFRALDPVTAVHATTGATLGLLEQRLSSPPAVPQDAEEQGAELLLRMLGLDAAEAHEVAHRPLRDLNSDGPSRDVTAT
jgi:AcrR family transcriptional regulator